MKSSNVWDQMDPFACNPERMSLWKSDVSSVSTGDIALTNAGVIRNSPSDLNSSLSARQLFNGIYGADRNFNLRVDRGSVPKSARMRAVEIARFYYYDPRVPLMLR
jgi:hypothetical protein